MNFRYIRLKIPCNKAPSPNSKVHLFDINQSHLMEISKISRVKTRWSFRREIFISADCSIKHMRVSNILSFPCWTKMHQKRTLNTVGCVYFLLCPSDTKQSVQNIIIPFCISYEIYKLLANSNNQCLKF